VYAGHKEPTVTAISFVVSDVFFILITHAFTKL
jgi:hypothetical protein